MGLFNFIYKLTNILSNKRKIKVFIIIAIIILLLFCWSRGAFAATPEDASSLSFYQLQLQNACMSYLTYLYKQGTYDQAELNKLILLLKTRNVYVLTTQAEQGQFIIFTYYINQVRSDGTIYNSINDFTIDGSFFLGATQDSSGNVTVSGTEFPCKLASLAGSSTLIARPTSSNTSISTIDSYRTYVPDACFGIRSNSINEFLTLVNAYSDVPPTYNTSDEELQAISEAGFENQVTAINQATSAINDVNSSVEDVNQSVNEMIETIVEPYVNVSQEQLPTQEVNDTTEDPLNTLFDYIKDAFTGEPTGFSLPLPFVRWRS